MLLNARAEGKALTLGGTSVATPFVTGAIALLWLEFSAATAAELQRVLTQANGFRRTTVVPPFQKNSRSSPGAENFVQFMVLTAWQGECNQNLLLGFGSVAWIWNAIFHFGS